MEVWEVRCEHQTWLGFWGRGLVFLRNRCERFLHCEKNIDTKLAKSNGNGRGSQEGHIKQLVFWVVIKLNHSDTWTFALIIHILSSVKMLIWEWGCHLLAHINPCLKSPCSALFISGKRTKLLQTPFPFLPSILPCLSLEGCGALDFEYVNSQLVISKPQQSLSSEFS